MTVSPIEEKGRSLYCWTDHRPSFRVCEEWIQPVTRFSTHSWGTPPMIGTRVKCLFFCLLVSPLQALTSLVPKLGPATESLEPRTTYKIAEGATPGTGSGRLGVPSSQRQPVSAPIRTWTTKGTPLPFVPEPRTSLEPTGPDPGCLRRRVWFWSHSFGRGSCVRFGSHKGRT